MMLRLFMRSPSKHVFTLYDAYLTIAMLYLLRDSVPGHFCRIGSGKLTVNIRSDTTDVIFRCISLSYLAE